MARDCSRASKELWNTCKDEGGGGDDDGDDGDDGDDDDDTHHEEVTAEKAFEKAMTEWVAKGSIPEDDPRLLQGQNPPTPVGTASGYNIEELDGSQYHQKKKRVYKRKNKIGM